MAPRAVRVAVDQEPDHVAQVLVRAGQPILKRQEVGAHVLGGARDEAQQLGDTSQHRHLLGARTLLFLLAAAQTLEQRHRAARRAVHLEAAEPRHLHQLAGRHADDHGVAVVATRRQRGQDGFEVLFHDQHGDHDDVTARDVLATTLEQLRGIGPFGRRMQRQLQAGQLALQGRARPLGGAGEVPVEIYNDDTDRGDVRGRGALVSGRSALWHRRASPQ